MYMTIKLINSCKDKLTTQQRKTTAGDMHGKDEDGKMFLLWRGISEREALKVADFFHKETGRTAIIVYSDQSREEAT